MVRVTTPQPAPRSPVPRSWAVVPTRDPTRPFATGPFTKLARTHAFGLAGDAIFAIALAGSVFFSLDFNSARWNVALYLVLTIAPFAVAAPLIGPLRPTTGVSFQYLNQNGSVTSVAANVRQIVITLRTLSSARDAGGDQVRDSLKTRVYTRN